MVTGLQERKSILKGSEKKFYRMCRRGRACYVQLHFFRSTAAKKCFVPGQLSSSISAVVGVFFAVEAPDSTVLLHHLKGVSLSFSVLYCIS